ncbi:MAG: hypothetical protein JRN34_05050 [Nitrososphaerota archaeon]|nr:hypothetical protein [Nitrososphaerota archaeon]MDG6942276.1 hypothetical protein [Nitrososphaerota archaeon]MDG6942741.1 hypothetical protein [Nitrososphaerota archaeon]MDG6948528.1 hypothetical protein [Nitrososphaerota archaeon]MDG6950454.1 hypothetical protein [Nitrososphaerota archaeon]
MSADGSRVECPRCKSEGRATSSGRVPYLVGGKFCVVCRYRYEGVDMKARRSEAARKAAETKARTQERDFDVFRP